MKTLKTSLEIVYDLEIVSFHNGSKETEVEVLVTCEEGTKEFTLSVNNYGEAYNEYDINGVIPDLDVTEIDLWVDTVTSQYICSELSKICIQKTNKNEYYSFSFGHISDITATLLVFEKNNDNIGNVVSSFHATGEEQIKELLNKLS